MDNINWSELAFGYVKTDYNVRCYYRNGKWGKVEISSSEYVPIHIAATAIHYGQESFEGMKAFKGKDGRVRLFRWEDNAKRMQDSAEGIMMAEPPVELFKEMINKVIKMNMRFVPPYGTGASLYIRPLLIGTGPQVGVRPADEYLLMIFVTPVGPYFKEGFSPVSMLITREFDRAAPLGTGKYKVGGNYAASLTSIKKAHDGGYANVLYLDAKEKKYIDECGPANFFGIKNNTYITPKSDSILPSITNKSLITLAEDMGLKTERRPVVLEELETFDEVGACGTAAVISPINKITDDESGKVYTYGKNPGEISTKLFNKLIAIQNGDEEDKFGWVDFVE
ncbi:MAG: branched-chain amino acid aminotransferase [Bacteroidales bacterium]|nr:branched-chain amino acid aminotransferase [Bacteroidales bacterium]